MTRATDDWGFASALDDVSGAVAIAGVGEADHTNASGRTVKQIALQAVERALADAGLAPEDVDGIMYTPFDGQQLTGADFRMHFGTSRDRSRRGGGMVQRDRRRTRPRCDAQGPGDHRGTRSPCGDAAVR
jgi:hypothetical protein